MGVPVAYPRIAVSRLCQRFLLRQNRRAMSSWRKKALPEQRLIQDYFTC
jgi:hypothetical protein